MDGRVVCVAKSLDREMWGWVIGRLSGFAGLGGNLGKIGEKGWIESSVSIIELATPYTHECGGASTATG
jgi:hypothetical protein